MSKKRKLNSSNPKWNKDKKNEKKYKRVLIKKTKSFKVYFLYEIDE